MPLPRFQPVIELTLPASLPADDSAAVQAAEREVLSLFDDCAGGLRRYLGSFGLGEEATEDVVQEVFLALFRHLLLGRPRTNLRGWLFQVGHNLALKQRQRSLARQQTERNWDADLAERVIDPAANP